MSTLPLRPGLEGETPYGAPELEVPVRLNVNENPYPPSPEVVQDIADAVAQAASTLNRYPDRDFPALRQALADYLAVESGVRVPWEQVWAANGSNEVMLHVLQVFGGPGRVCLSFTPTYSMYPEYARDTLTRYVAAARAEDFTLEVDVVREAVAAHHPAVILLASPNNPTGTALPLDDVRAVLEAARGQGPLAADGSATDCVVVVDEAYGEFRRPGVPSALELLALEDGQAYLSALPQAAAMAALAHREELMSQVAAMRADRDALVQWLREQGWTACDSDSNFVLFGPFADRDAVFRAMLERGVLIRVVGPAGYLRVCIGTPEEMEAFRRSLQAVTSDLPRPQRAHTPKEIHA